MESINHELYADETSVLDDTPAINNPTVLCDLTLRRQNAQDLRSLQNTILIEEDAALSLDEVLARVLAFYGRFVQFKKNSH